MISLATVDPTAQGLGGQMASVNDEHDAATLGLLEFYPQFICLARRTYFRCGFLREEILGPRPHKSILLRGNAIGLHQSYSKECVDTWHMVVASWERPLQQ